AVGRTLTARAGSWPSGTALKYQWYRSGKAIKGATHRTYRVAAADRGLRLKVRVTGPKPGYAAVRKASASAGPVARGKLRTPAARITGTLKVGRTLTARAGRWTSGTALKYQWYRSGKAIKGAAHRTYRVTAA
ncbi:hypothetical protein HER39_06570, partial [Arthrobacter deserti]|nr:hypothetical protein [Arthrobacter deserti]